MRARGDPADPHVDSGHAGSEVSAAALLAEVAGAHALDPRQPADPRARRPRRRVDQHGGRRRARHRRRPAGARIQRSRRQHPARARHRSHPAGRRVDQGRHLVHAERGRRRHARLLQRADRRSLRAVGRLDLQQQLRPN